MTLQRDGIMLNANLLQTFIGFVKFRTSNWSNVWLFAIGCHKEELSAKFLGDKSASELKHSL